MQADSKSQAGAVWTAMILTASHSALRCRLAATKPRWISHHKCETCPPPRAPRAVFPVAASLLPCYTTNLDACDAKSPLGCLNCISRYSPISRHHRRRLPSCPSLALGIHPSIPPPLDPSVSLQHLSAPSSSRPRSARRSARPLACLPTPPPPLPPPPGAGVGSPDISRPSERLVCFGCAQGWRAN